MNEIFRPYVTAAPETLRLVSFLSLFVILALAEKIWPKRQLTIKKQQRWTVNLTLVLFNSLMLRYIFPIAPFGIALLSDANGWGLFNLFRIPEPFEIAASILMLDFVIYLQHRLFHRIQLFWRIHRVHHIDLDLDISTGVRFHPIEIAISLAIKLITVILLGASPLSVLLFEILLNATAMFSHANLGIPVSIDRWLRLLLVTPDMHRIHHSIVARETDSNFGFNIPWWDRLLGTYKAEPIEGHERMTIGLKEFRQFKNLWQSLEIPFINTAKIKRCND